MTAESQETAEPGINWTLIQQLADKPHKHMSIVEAAEYGLVMGDNGVFSTGNHGIGEVMYEARTVQHLCDMAGIPEGEGHSAHIDARVWLLLVDRIRLADRLDRLRSWHSRETAEGGMVGDFCNECGQKWPCDSFRMAAGTFRDDASEGEQQ